MSRGYVCIITRGGELKCMEYENLFCMCEIWRIIIRSIHPCLGHNIQAQAMLLQACHSICSPTSPFHQIPQEFQNLPCCISQEIKTLTIIVFFLLLPFFFFWAIPQWLDFIFCVKNWSTSVGSRSEHIALVSFAVFETNIPRPRLILVMTYIYRIWCNKH